MMTDVSKQQHVLMANTCMSFFTIQNKETEDLFLTNTRCRHPKVKTVVHHLKISIHRVYEKSIVDTHGYKNEIFDEKKTFSVGIV